MAVNYSSRTGAADRLCQTRQPCGLRAGILSAPKPGHRSRDRRLRRHASETAAIGLRTAPHLDGEERRGHRPVPALSAGGGRRRAPQLARPHGGPPRHRQQCQPPHTRTGCIWCKPSPCCPRPCAPAHHGRGGGHVALITATNRDAPQRVAGQLTTAAASGCGCEPRRARRRARPWAGTPRTGSSRPR